jgi:cellulose synthase/poly-beta-1,6-N-acetylglucosamine synthase-like glycosyltransferase
MLILWHVLTVLLLIEAIITTVTTSRFRKFFLSRLKQKSDDLSDFPRVAMLIPCKGLDSNLQANAQSWLHQNYPNYKVFVVVEALDDPAKQILEELEFKVFIAGRAEDCGQKIHNLRYLIEQLPEDIDVFVFADSDGRLKSDWLGSLIHELLIHREDAVTGYRWFIPERSLFSHFRAVWNSGVLTLFSESGRGNFAWGGATALFKKTFYETDVLSHWKGSLSDDLSLTRAFYSAGRRIHFAPKAIAISEDSIHAKEFVSWIARQFLITKLYHPKLWAATFAYHWLWFIWLVLGIFLMPVQCLMIFLLFQIFQGVKAVIRLDCMRHLLERSPGSRVVAWLLSPLIGLINTVVLTSNLFSRTILWRGIGYRVDGPNQLTIVSRS